ncbi:MAG: DUF4405 domain-containing protein [Sedimentisphaerales bacterium]
MSNDTKKQFNWRSFISVLTALSFIGMTFTGVILFVVPPGRVANWTGWTLIGLTKHEWIGLHDWFSIIFVAASVIHLYLNWKPFVSYFKSKATKAFALRSEWAAALVVCAVIFACTLGNIRPFSSLLAWNENIKHSWESPQQRAPIPHAELMSLAELANQVQDVDLETMLANLKAAGIEVESADIVLGKLAEAHNITPVQLYNIALGQAGPGRGHGGGGHGAESEELGGGGPGRGFGKMTMKQYCEQMGLDVNTAVKKLQDAGFKAGPDMTIRGIADSAGGHPSEIRAVIDPPIQ